MLHHLLSFAPARLYRPLLEPHYNPAKLPSEPKKECSDLSIIQRSSRPQPTMSDRVPQEIKDEILAYFWNDIHTLHACSLTCRTFLHTCRTYIFAKIVLFEPAHASKRTGLNFQGLLQTSPHIGSYVQHLELHDEEYTEWLCQDTTLSFCMPHLFNLKALVIRIKVWEDPKQLWTLIRQGRFFSATMDILHFPSLVCLDLSWLPFQLVRHCQCLNHLSVRLSSVIFGEIDSSTCCNTAAKLSVGSLQIEALDPERHPQALFHMIKAADELCNIIDVRTIRTFIGNATVTIEGHRILWQIMKNFAPTLEVLVFIPCVHGEFITTC